MKKKPPDNPQYPSTLKLEEILAKVTELTNTLASNGKEVKTSKQKKIDAEKILVGMKSLRDELAAIEAATGRRKNKHIRNKKDMKNKMAFAEKAFQLAMEHPEFATPEFIEKFWESHARYLLAKDLMEKSKKLHEALLKLCPEAAIPYNTYSTETNG